MAVSTIDLGISILMGGNTDVQKVGKIYRVNISFCWTWYPVISSYVAENVGCRTDQWC